VIGYAGLSHLGLVSCAAAAARGIDVVAWDPDPAVVTALAAHRLAVNEPGLPELLAQARPRLMFAVDGAALGACDVVYVSVDVPTDDDHASDLSAVEAVVDAVVLGLRADAVLVVLSQVRPGFTRGLAARLARMHPHLRVFYQVETLIFGRAVLRACEPERYIVGAADPDVALPAAYAAFLAAWPCPVLRMRYESAELTKIAINLFLASTVTTTNTLAELCEAIGADWAEIAPALRLDRRIGLHAYLAPGLGIGGGNLGRDLATVQGLAAEHGCEAGVVDAWITASAHRRDWTVRLLHERVLARVPSPVIAVWGLAYKADTQSTKNSPAVALLDALRPFTVRAYDPVARVDAAAYPGLTVCADAREACRDADVLVVMTPWREFAEVDPKEIRDRVRGTLVLDPFRVLDARACAAAGLDHVALGAPPTAPREGA
jgi:UDPglucose 6-dehydrogenase